MTWRAGFGSSVITPATPVMLAGFSDRTEPATGVHDELEARAVWLDDGTRAACLLVLDLLGLSEEFAGPVRDAIAEDLGVDREAVLTAATHTHNGPNAIRGGELLGGRSRKGTATCWSSGAVPPRRRPARRRSQPLSTRPRPPFPRVSR